MNRPIGVLAGVGIVVALALLVVPGLFESIVPASLTFGHRDPDPDRLLPVVGITLVGIGIRLLRSDRGTSLPPFDSGPSGGGNATRGVRPGQAFRADVREAIGRRYWTGEPSNAVEIEEQLRTAAIYAYQREYGVDLDSAHDAVATGSWTADPIAAAFLFEEGAESDDRPGYPLANRLRSRIDPGQTYGRRVERTAQAIAALHPAIDADGGDRSLDEADKATSSEEGSS